MVFLVTSTTWRWTNGVCHDIHMDDGDAQLPTPAQQPESDLCLVSTTFSIANRRWGVSAISCKVAESGWYSNADKASFNSKGECFPVIRHCRHAESSTTHCSLVHSTISSLCSPESPQRHHLSTLSQLLSLLQSIFPSTRKLLFSKSQYQNILILTNSSPISLWLLRIAKRELSKHAMTWPYVPHIIVASLASVTKLG